MTSFLQSVKLIKANGPRAEDFGLPRTENDLESMMTKMVECGFSKTKAIEIMTERKERFNEACKDYKKQHGI